SIDEKDYMLLLTSYANDSKQVVDFMQEFEDVNANCPLEVKIESLGILGLANINHWRIDMLKILRRQNPKYLKAIMIIGQEAFATYMSLGDQRPDIPYYVSKVSDQGIVIPDERINPAQWEPTSVSNRDIMRKIGFGGAIFQSYNVAANVELIKKIYPETKHIALLTDNTYGGLSIYANFRKVMDDTYYDINAILIDGRKLSINEIQDTIASLPPHSVLMLGSWRVDNKGTFFTNKLLQELVSIHPDLPIFSLSGLGMRDIAIAGVIPSYDTPLNDFLNVVFESINNGGKDKFYLEIPSEININMGNIRKMHIDETLLPEKYRIVDSENERVLRYRRYLWIVGGVSTLMLLMLIFVIWLALKTRQQNKLLNQQATELKIAKEQAEVSDNLKSAFLANISHQIRTPLNAITGFASLINKSQSIDNVKEYLKYINESNDKLLRLLTLIMDFAKVDSGIVEYHMTDINLEKLFDSIYQHYAPRINEDIKFECYKPYDCTITYDAEKLEQMITILLDNAIKFTRSGTITIGYFANPKSIIIYVTDTGIGIQKKNIDKIFNRFEKLDSFTEGTGIGLSLVKTLVERSGGNIKVVSRPEAGSRFIVEIPCPISTSTSDLAAYDRTSELMNEDSLIVDKQLEKPLKILVAEDNMSNFLILKTILKTHNITHVVDGDEAVNAIKNDWFDIVLMDIKMPNKDGITATTEIRKFDLATPIIAVTAFEPDNYMRQAQQAGCDYFIEKPFTRSKLYSAILGLMNK
ncbi:MAG: hybrid sensor histidine kinase/response regulator, partial [Bacteroidales bacterium]|nr:hybrid sensor histidine kinase/response regulator [Bacteroidales bacterium]